VLWKAIRRVCSRWWREIPRRHTDSWFK